MILGADNQNKNLRIASRIKSNPTAKTKTANHYSAAVSTSKTVENSSSAKNQRTTVHQSRSKINDGKPDPIRGSMEGLDNSKSAYIQQNNRGYDSKTLQTKRYANPSKNINPQKGASFIFTNQQNKSIISNYTKSSVTGSSSHIMNNNLNMNRYF
jgi:hypothetical protein